MVVNKKQKDFINTAKKKSNLAVGDICQLTITALATNGIGIDESSYPYAILVPNAKLGSKIKAKIVRISKDKIKTQKYAIAQLVEELATNAIATPVNPGDVISVTVNCLPSTDGPFGQKGAAIALLENNYKLIIPGVSATKGEKLSVSVTRVKNGYAFARLSQSVKKGNSSVKENLTLLGGKLTLTLPTQAKLFKNKYYILKVATQALSSPSYLFLKLDLGAKLGDKVRIKVVKTQNNFAIGQIIKVMPQGANSLFNFTSQQALRLAKKIRRSAILTNIRQMVKNGMHFGEKAIKCHARMKNYVWANSQNSFSSEARKLSSLKTKKGRHIINLFKTRRCLNKALNQLGKYALKGRTFLFIGTKKPAAGLIARASYFSKNSFFVNTRWLGGMLTNWKTIKESIRKIRPILKEKQKVVRDILTKRQNIKLRLIQKAVLLRKKSQVILTKGKNLLALLKNSEKRKSLFVSERILAEKQKELLVKGENIITILKKLKNKQRKLVLLTNLLKEKAVLINSNFKTLVNQLIISTKKLREYKSLLILIKEIRSIKAQAIQQNQTLYSVSYGKLKEVTANTQENWVVPNPPKEILNRIVLLLKNNMATSENLSAVTAKNQSQQNIIVLSKLITGFASGFKSYIQTLIKTTQASIQTILEKCQNLVASAKSVKVVLAKYTEFQNSFKQEFQTFKQKLVAERAVIRIVKRKLKVLLAQKKLLQFLPRLRYLPTPQTQISLIVQILLKKIVDPKLKYPIDSIYDQKLSVIKTNKKDAAARKKKWQRLEKYFGGIANMTKLNKTGISRNIAIIVGQKEEMNAVRECQKLQMKTFSIVDTNCNPLLSDHIIPANDDSRNSIKYILNQFITRIRLAQKLRQTLLLRKRVI